MVIVVEACLGHGTSDSLKDGWEEGKERTSINAPGLANSISIIIFAFMYQVNIPALYSELENKDEKKIKFVIIIGTILACVLYIMAGIFGFMSFASNTSD